VTTPLRSRRLEIAAAVKTNAHEPPAECEQAPRDPVSMIAAPIKAPIGHAASRSARDVPRRRT